MSLLPIAAALCRLSWPFRAAVPAVLYLVLAAADLLFSLVAFSYGIAEGNPFMAWLLERGLFVPGKIALSLLVAGLMLAVYTRSPRWGWVAWGGVTVMTGVLALHLWALPRLLPPPRPAGPLARAGGMAGLEARERALRLRVLGVDLEREAQTASRLGGTASADHRFGDEHVGVHVMAIPAQQQPARVLGLIVAP